MRVLHRVSYNKPFLTSHLGDNAEAFRDILLHYALSRFGRVENLSILDATWGRGNFWKYLDTSVFRLTRNDLHKDGLELKSDFRNLPLKASSQHFFVLDPPYAKHGKGSRKPSIALPYGCDHRAEGSEKAIIYSYLAGAKEALRVLKPGGILILKTQDAIESGKFVSKTAALSSLEGFEHINNHVLMQSGIPLMRYDYQINARQNHSYFMIFAKRVPSKSKNKTKVLSVLTFKSGVSKKQKTSMLQTERKLRQCILKMQGRGEDVTKSEVARRVGIARETIYRRYSKLFKKKTRT